MGFRLSAVLIAVLFFAVSALQPVGAATIEERKLAPVQPAIMAPATRYFDGNNWVGLDALRGQTLVVNVWATWCGPCLTEMPSLDRLADKIAGDGVVVVALSQDSGGQSQVKPYLEKLKVSRLLNLYDTDLRAMQDFGIRGLPTTFVISPQGRIVARLEGAAVWDSNEMIRQIRSYAGRP